MNKWKMQEALWNIRAYERGIRSLKEMRQACKQYKRMISSYYRQASGKIKRPIARKKAIMLIGKRREHRLNRAEREKANHE